MNSESPENSDKPFRFSLWDLLALTTFIAVLMGLPHELLGFIVAVSLTIALLIAVPALSGVFFGPVNERTVSRTVYRVTSRAFLFLLATILVGLFSLATR
jgi:hypothetical protein